MAKTNKSPLNSKVIILAVVLILLGVVAYFLFANQGKKDEKALVSGNAFTSIKDALSKSLSLSCEFTDTNGVVSKVSIKNGAMRGEFTGSSPEQSGNMIVKDKKMYFWNGSEGIMMEIPEGENWDSDSQTLGQSGDFMKEIEQYKDNCKPAVVSDSIFTPPTDVKFSDFSKFNPQTSGGEEMSEEDLKKIMEQYQE